MVFLLLLYALGLGDSDIPTFWLILLQPVPFNQLDFLAKVCYRPCCMAQPRLLCLHGKGREWAGASRAKSLYVSLHMYTHIHIYVNKMCSHLFICIYRYDMYI